MRARIVLILMALTFLWAMMIGRAGYLQFAPDPRLKALQRRQFETVVTLNPRRGDVLDRNGHELAVSMTSYSLFVDPKIIEEPKVVAKLLSKELKLPLKQVEDKLKNRKRRFVWIQRHIDKSAHDAIEEQKIRGLGFIEESKRIYPNDRLLSHVLGFVGGEEQGLEGLELRYNDHLQAAKKKVNVRRDARGRPLIVNGQMFNQVPDGADLQLTIDRETQFILEQELQQAVTRHVADAAYGVVLDAQTSEILAMASVPTFDPNKSASFSPDMKRNRSVTDSYEPGSTMKTFVIAGAIAKGIVQPETKINAEGGVMRIGKRVIREADAKHRFNTISVSDILAVSSNIGTTKVAFKMGSEGVLESLKNFGFGEKTGVDLPGEAKGIMQPLPWRDHLLANISFGHGITATPLQIANAYAVIANGGWLKRPYVVKKIVDHENSEEHEMQPQNVRRVLTDDQVAKMRHMLLGVTASKEGTGANARVPGFPVAGKTGTAQKVNPNGRGYLRGGYVSSFAGFLPANNPRFVIYIAVDHPLKEYYGAAVAAPVFSRVASFAVRKAGLAPITDAEGFRLTKIDKAVVPDVDGFDGEMHDAEVKEAREVATNGQNAVATNDAKSNPNGKETDSKLSLTSLAKRLGFEKSEKEESSEPSVQGDVAPPMFSTSVVKLQPAVVESVDSAAAPVSEPGAEPGMIAAAVEDGVVPDLTGMTLREVLSRVSGTGIQVHVKGQGFVNQTLPLPGARFGSNKQMTIYLSRIHE